MKSIYNAAYLLIFIRFLRELAAEFCPSKGAKKFSLYLNLSKYSLSIRIARSRSWARLSHTKQGIVEGGYREECLEITDSNPVYKPVDLFSQRVSEIFSRESLGIIIDNVDKYIGINCRL